MKEIIKKGQLEGMYKMMNLDDNGNIVWESDWVHNQIVDSYAFCLTQLFLDKDLITSKAPFMGIGTDRTQSNANNVRLGNERFRVLTKVAKADMQTDSDGLYQSSDGNDINGIDITGIFEKGIALDIGEIGLFWGKGASSSLNTGVLLSRKDIPSGWDKSSDTRSIFVYRLIFRSV